MAPGYDGSVTVKLQHDGFLARLLPILGLIVIALLLVISVLVVVALTVAGATGVEDAANPDEVGDDSQEDEGSEESEGGGRARGVEIEEPGLALIELVLLGVGGGREAEQDAS